MSSFNHHKHHVPRWSCARFQSSQVRGVDIKRWLRSSVAPLGLLAFVASAAVSPALAQGAPQAERKPADGQVVGDIAGAMAYLRAQPEANGKVGLIGFCSGGRHAYLCAGSIPDVDALVDCWGGNKFADNKNNPAKRPVAPIELTEKITAPVLGIYGNDDKNPSPEDVNKTEERLKKAGKNYEFHRYDGAGHGFFNAPRPAYRPEQAQDAWKKVFAFFEKHLSR